MHHSVILSSVSLSVFSFPILLFSLIPPPPNLSLLNSSCPRHALSIPAFPVVIYISSSSTHVHLGVLLITNGVKGAKAFDIFGPGRCGNIRKRREGNLVFVSYTYTSSVFSFSLFMSHMCWVACLYRPCAYRGWIPSSSCSCLSFPDCCIRGMEYHKLK